ncbi:Cation channel sperm-associated protein 1 [Coelomomyces lativittatus]|nr:Cation channel sperm-associated protein 1 [Coelomomyces lativittatus]
MSENANFSSDMSRFFNTESANYSWFRKQCFYISSSNLFSSSILAVIGINTLILALQTTYILNSNYGWYFAVLDQVFLGIYIMEMLLKIYVYRWFYFKSGWNNFGIQIVASPNFHGLYLF